MTVTLELKPEEVAALNDRAEGEGVDIETILHSLIAQMAQTAGAVKPTLTDKQRSAFVLMQAGRQKDEIDDPEELAERDRELEEFQANINRWHREQGSIPPF